MKPKGKAKTEQLASYRFSSFSEMFQQQMLSHPLPLLTNIDPGRRFSCAWTMLFSMPSTRASNDWRTNPRDVTIYTTYWRYPPGPAWVWIPLIATLFSVYTSPYLSNKIKCNVRTVKTGAVSYYRTPTIMGFRKRLDQNSLHQDNHEVKLT